MSTTAQREQEATRVEVIGCGCKSHFCRSCGFAKGRAIYKQLMTALVWCLDLPRPEREGEEIVYRKLDWSSKRGLLVTLTINPSWSFPTPEAAFRYVHKKGLVSRLHRWLRQQGYVEGPHYVWVLEFQENGWPHWHLLVDSDFIPHEQLWRKWSSYAPKVERAYWLSVEEQAKAEAQQQNTGHNPMGFVYAGRKKSGSRLLFNEVGHGVGYICKYISKPPKHPWPEWVMTFEGQFRRWGHSHGLLWTEPAPIPLPEGDLGYPPEWDELDDDPEEEDTEGKYGRVAKTVGGRVSACGSRCVVVRRSEWIDRHGELKQETNFLGAIDTGLPDVRRLAGIPEPENPTKRMEVTPEQLTRVMNYAELPKWKQREREIAAKWKERNTDAKQRALFEVVEVGPPRDEKLSHYAGGL